MMPRAARPAANHNNTSRHWRDVRSVLGTAFDMGPSVPDWVQRRLRGRADRWSHHLAGSAPSESDRRNAPDPDTALMEKARLSARLLDPGERFGLRVTLFAVAIV